MQNVEVKINACRQNGPLAPESGIFGPRTRLVIRSLLVLISLIFLLLLPVACVTQGDFLSLQEKVAEHHMSDQNEPDPFTRIAKLSADVDALRQEIRDLQGELEIARKESSDALEEGRRTRIAVAQGAKPSAQAEAAGSAGEPGVAGADESGQTVAAGGLATDSGSGAAAPKPDEELAGYQAALDAWRTDQYGECIERFTGFLQAYPTSGYADDAAYWLADCTFKNGEFKRAVVRFNAVVSVYPESPKAPDALYRQGESLLKLGPKFYEAARTVFKRVQKDYPDSERSAEAEQQLERLGSDKSPT
jgi:tol-pal system protein YbgF